MFSLFTSLLPRKGILAIAAVVDVALQTVGQPISARTLAVRHGLPLRGLEPVLQSLVRDGILRGVRGPRGGYALACDCGRVTVSDILRAAGTVDGMEERPASDLVLKVVLPALSPAEHEFDRTLNRIKLEDMMRQAEKLNAAGSGAGTLKRPSAPFTIWTLSARFRLRVKSSDSRVRSRLDPLAMAVTASRG